MIYDDKNFAKKFPAQHSELVRRFYRSNVPEVRLRCSTVQELRTMEDNVKRKFSFRGSSEIIQTLSNLGLLRDYTVSDALNSIYGEFYSQLGQVYDLLEQGRAQEARKKLQSFISKARTDIEQIQSLLGGLGEIRRLLER